MFCLLKVPQPVKKTPVSAKKPPAKADPESDSDEDDSEDDDDSEDVRLVYFPGVEPNWQSTDRHTSS